MPRCISFASRRFRFFVHFVMYEIFFSSPIGLCLDYVSFQDQVIFFRSLLGLFAFILSRNYEQTLQDREQSSASNLLVADTQNIFCSKKDLFQEKTKYIKVKRDNTTTIVIINDIIVLRKQKRRSFWIILDFPKVQGS